MFLKHKQVHETSSRTRNKKSWDNEYARWYREPNAAYYGTLRLMPVNQLFYINKANGGYPMDYLCEFVKVDARGLCYS